MAQNNFENSTKFPFDKISKEGAIMPTIITKILGMEGFRNSGVYEEELRLSIRVILNE